MKITFEIQKIEKKNILILHKFQSCIVYHHGDKTETRMSASFNSIIEKINAEMYGLLDNDYRRHMNSIIDNIYEKSKFSVPQKMVLNKFKKNFRDIVEIKTGDMIIDCQYIDDIYLIDGAYKRFVIDNHKENNVERVKNREFDSVIDRITVKVSLFRDLIAVITFSNSRYFRSVLERETVIKHYEDIRFAFRSMCAEMYLMHHLMRHSDDLLFSFKKESDMNIRVPRRKNIKKIERFEIRFIEFRFDDIYVKQDYLDRIYEFHHRDTHYKYLIDY